MTALELFGKTHLVCALVNSLCDRAYRAQYCTFSEIVKWLRSTWRPDSALQELDALRQLWALDLLVIDEVGAQKGTDGEQQHAFEIIDKRYRDMKPTIVLGNTGTDGILQYLGARIVDRLLENGGLKLKLDGKSARLSR